MLHMLGARGQKPRHGTLRGLVIVAVLLIILGSGCSRATPTAEVAVTPEAAASPTVEEVQHTPTLTPTVTEPSLDQHRDTTAAQSFPAAYRRAQAWLPDAMWYGVIPYASIERAFALPLDDDRPSWHYRFASPDGSRELVVEVRGGEVLGSTETRLPDYIEPPISELNALDPSFEGVVDSEAALRSYREHEDSLLVRFPAMYLDYRLSHPKDVTDPTWQIYNAQSMAEPVATVDATSGEVIVEAEPE